MDRRSVQHRVARAGRPLATIALICVVSLLIFTSTASRPIARTVAGSPARRMLADPASPLVVGLAPDYLTTLAGRVYVSNCAGNSVSVVDEATHTVVATVPVGAAGPACVVSTDQRLCHVPDDQAVHQRWLPHCALD